MADLAAHLVDVVLPHVPVRQWVLSLPHRIRFVLAYDPDRCREVRAIFVRGVLNWIKGRAKATGAPNGRGGAVCFLQRSDSGAQLHLRRGTRLQAGCGATPERGGVGRRATMNRKRRRAPGGAAEAAPEPLSV